MNGGIKPEMTFRSITEAFLEIEDELNLFEQRIDGVYFWERIRFPLHRQILESTGVTGQAHTKLEHTLTNMIRIALRSIKNLFVKNPYLAPKSEILFLGSPRRKLRHDGQYWDLYCDPIIENLNRSYVYFEPAYLGTHLTPAKTGNIWYLDLPLFLAVVKRKLKAVNVSLAKQEILLLRDLQKKIEERFNVRLNLEEMVKRDLLIRKSTLPVYAKLLKKVSPKLVIVVCSYGKETFIEACKSLGVPVVELQHGVISSYHLGYSFPDPHRIKRTFPDYLFVFGDFWKEGIGYPIGRERIYSVGYPYLESEVQRYAEIKKRDQLVFISQGTIGNAMSKFAVALSERKDFPFEIAYKLHPGEYARWRKEYPWLLASKIKVVEDDEIPLYLLFAQSRMQVGVYSTAIFEGLYFGLKTVLLNLPGVEYMDQLVKEQVARVVTSPEELVKVIKEEAPKVNMERFFRPDSLNNIMKAISELLGGASYVVG